MYTIFNVQKLRRTQRSAAEATPPQSCPVVLGTVKQDLTMFTGVFVVPYFRMLRAMPRPAFLLARKREGELSYSVSFVSLLMAELTCC
jgi:hypothetical protein